jgi:hypothetical protein
MNDRQDKPVLIDCPACDTKVSDQALACPKCGQPIARQYKKTRFGQPIIDVAPRLGSVEFKNTQWPPPPILQPSSSGPSTWEEPHSRQGKVEIWLGICIFIMPYIFAWFTLRKDFTNRARAYSFGWLTFFVLMVAIAPRESRQNSVVSNTTQTASAQSDPPKQDTLSRTETAPTGINPNKAVTSLRKKVMSISAGRQLISSIEAGDIPGVLVIHVSNAWFDGDTYQKRQLISQLVSLWQQELGTNNAIVHIYDRTGHEVGGTKFLGGVWVEDE